MGSLCGTAMAGLPDNDSAIILALDFRPTQIQIAGVVAAGHKAGSLKTAEFARIDAGNIVVEPFLGNNPFAKMPWPEVR
jgi:septum site-determining protein MinC